MALKILIEPCGARPVPTGPKTAAHTALNARAAGPITLPAVRAALGVVAAIGLATGPAPAAADDLLSSAALSGGQGQARIVCYFTNVVDKPVALSAYRIISEAGASLPLVIDGCGGSELHARRTCGIAANVADGAGYACRARVADREKIRGTIESRSSNQSTLAVQAMQ